MSNIVERFINFTNPNNAKSYYPSLLTGQGDRIDGIIRGYLGAFTEASFRASLQSLNAEVERGANRISRLPRHLFLVDEWGLTGICAAYALECANWVGRHGASTSLPALMPREPHEHMKHLQRLLILAIYQSIPKAMSPIKLNRQPENRDYVNRTIEAFTALQRERTGLHIVGASPGPTYFETAPMHQLVSDFSRFTSQDHLLFVMGNESVPICAWHVIYANPKLGIIADARSGLLWKIDQEQLGHFTEVFRDFLEREGYISERTMRLHVRGNSDFVCRTPLLQDRIVRRTQTAGAILRHSGLISAIQYLYAVNQYNPLISSGIEEFIGKLGEFSENLETFQELPAFVRRNLHVASQLERYEHSSKIREQFPPGYWNGLLVGGKGEILLQVLRKIQALGPRARPCSAILQRSILEAIYNRGPETFPEYVRTTFMRSLFDLRREIPRNDRYEIDSLMTVMNYDDRHIPYYEQLLREGANVNGSEFSRTPYERVCEYRDERLQMFFHERGGICRPPKQPKPLSHLDKVVKILWNHKDKIAAFAAGVVLRGWGAGLAACGLYSLSKRIFFR